MTTQSSTFIKLSIVLLMLSVFGCTKNSSTPLSPSSQTTQPKGTITGLIRNWVTSEPVPLAKISVGYNGTVQSTISDSAGAFSFAEVPAGQYSVVNGAPVLSGTYTFTVSLVNYDSAQTDPNKKYRAYYYSTANITFTSVGQNDSSSINGMIGSVLLNISYLNTTVKGEVVDQNMQPVQSALVTLYDETVVPGVAMAQTSTDSNGSYQFKNVDNGLTVNIVAVSNDGSQGGKLPGFLTLPPNLTIDSLRSGVPAERIMLTPVDVTNPYVISITPENNSDVSPTGLQIVYTFSEPIKQTTYTNTNLPLGSKTMLDDIALNFIGMKKASDALGFTAQWNSTFSQLTIVPLGLVGSARYTLDMTAVFGSGKIKDAAGNALINNQMITGDFELLDFTTSGGSTVPAAPVVTRRIVPGQFGYLDYNGGTVALEWNYDPNARSYNIYKSIDGGSSQLLQTDYQGVQFQDNSGSLVVPSGANDPLSAGYVSYIVRAVSKDLVESTSSNVITVTDNVSPRLTNVTVAAAGGAYDWIYTLQFSEPLAVSAAEVASNYTILNPDTVSFNIREADYLGHNAGSNRYHVQLLVTTNLPQPAGYSLQVGSTAVTDLAGNSVDPATNVFTFSAPPVPILSSPNDGATLVGLPITLMWKTANGATSYHLQISTVNTFATTVVDNSGITTTTYDAGAPALTTGTLYYWRVSATNAAGTTAYSAVRRFTP
jgi:hypothetical protein